MARVLVTGANRGIGLELCRQLAGRGEDVIGACRARSAALTSLGVEVIEGVDVGSADSAGRLRDGLRGRKLELLVNNAGILRKDALGSLDFDSIRQQLEVNALGPLRVTETLLDLMTAPSKIAMITSRMGSIGDNTSGGYYGYRMSKAALNIASVSLAHDLRDRGISVVVLHPGFVRTEMTGGRGTMEVADAARGLIARIDELTPDSSGSFLLSTGEPLPW